MWSISRILLCSFLFLFPQKAEEKKSDDEFLVRRKALAKQLENGILFLEGEKEPESERRFIQDDDFYYLTGVETVDSALFLKVEKGQLLEEILFLPTKSLYWERWNGARLSPGEEAEKATGLRKTLATSEIKKTLSEALPQAKTIYAPMTTSGHGKKARTLKSSLLQELVKDSKIELGNFREKLDSLQVDKSLGEINKLEQAARITEKGLTAAIPYLHPGSFEYEMMGAVEGTFLKEGAEDFSFPSIIGSGPNSCRLHYQSNRRQMQQDELVVVDIGAKYQYYCSDITRTLPVSGKFSKRQAEIYNLVLEAQKRAMEAAKPGVYVHEVHAAAFDFLAEKGHERNFWHSTSHFVGLKAHDTPTSYDYELKAGMVITVEPGIYLPEENLGVRIEDVILITSDGYRLLSSGIPREIPELEAWIEKNKKP